MRKTKRTGNFLVCLLFNMFLNFEWSIPAWVLLILHFWVGLPLICFWIAFAAWIIIMLSWMSIIGWASDCSSQPDPPKENKNPYSNKG